MHVVANGISPSDTALGSFRTLRVTKESVHARRVICHRICHNTILLFADILATHFKTAQCLEKYGKRICILTRKSFSESYVLWSARKG